MYRSNESMARTSPRRTVRLCPFLVLLVAALAACDDPEPSAPAETGSAERAVELLKTAHDAYVAGHLGETTSRVRAVLEAAGEDDDVRANAVALVEAAYDAGEGRLPADWTLPPGVRELRFDHVRREAPTHVDFRVLVSGVSDAADTVSQLRLTRARDGAVLLDKRAGRGHWSTEPEEGRFFFELESEETDEPMTDGLYLVAWELADGSDGSGWFVASGLVASTSPVVDAPAPGERVASRRPTVRWRDFRSPELARHDRRAMGVYLMRLTPGSEPGWRYVWSLWTGDAGAGSATVGEDARGSGPVSLENGRYWVSVTFKEARRFGPMTLGRMSRTARPFEVLSTR